MTEPTEDTGALALVTVANVPALFSSETALEAMLSAIEKAARAEVPDLTTAKGRKAIASLAYKVAQSKTALDAAGKALNDDARAKIDAVDAERRKVRDRLDKLRDEIRQPLTDWEAAEEARVARLEERLAVFAATDVSLTMQTANIQPVLRALEAIVIGPDWEEFAERAEAAKADALRRVRFAYDMAVEREAEAAEAARQRAENERLRAVIAEQERVEADRLAAERAAEEQRLAAERKAAEDQRLADEAAAALERQRVAATEAERQAVIEREAAAEAARVAAEEKAAADAKAAQDAADAREADLKRQIEEANARTERAAQAERDRLAREAQAAEDARAKREADAAHRTRIRAEIALALFGLSDVESGTRIADALMAGQVPHVQVML